MRFISIIITFLIIFNFNSLAYSEDYNSFQTDVISNINIDNSFYLNKDNDSLSLITEKNDINGLLNTFIVGYIPLLISYIFSSFFLLLSTLYLSVSSSNGNFSLTNIFAGNIESLLLFNSSLQLYIFSILSGVFLLSYSDKNYEPNILMTIIGALVGTIAYFVSFNFSVLLESQITNNNKSSLANSSFLILILIMPIFTSTFATIFYNLSKKPKEKLLTEAEIVEEQRKIQESLLSSLNNIQVNRGNIEYKVLSF
ncbi:MAG: hypothetical protein ACK4IX_03520 [Candidatus Sericytochromatia bacterium]